jgi:hypothetical protein
MKGAYSYCELIPLRYRKSSALDSYTFKVQDPSWHWLQYSKQKTNGDLIIREAVSCKINVKGNERRLIVDKQAFPRLSEAIYLTGRGMIAGSRVERIMNIVKAYESLEPNPDIALIAFRHGLSHASSVLNRKSTTEQLEKDFGTKNIDLSNSRHVRIVYLKFAQILLINDGLMYRFLLQNIDEFTNETFCLSRGRIDGIQPYISNKTQ